jgi:hypothetical protein
VEPAEPVASPHDLIDNLRAELEDMARAEVAAYNDRRAAAGHGPEVEYVIHPREHVRLISHVVPSTLLIEIAADELAINIVMATNQEPQHGYPKQVPLLVALENGVPMLQARCNPAEPRAVLAAAFAEYFGLLRGAISN